MFGLFKNRHNSSITGNGNYISQVSGGNNTITINGKKYFADTPIDVQIGDIHITIPNLNKEFKVNIEGDVKGDIKLGTGNITVNNVRGNVSTSCGDITVNGDCNNVSVSCGDVKIIKNK